MMKQMMLVMSLLISFSASASSDKPDESYFYYGEYKLQTKSKNAKFYGLEKIVVKNVVGSNSTHLIVLHSGKRFHERSVGGQYSYANQRFEFSSGNSNLNWCDDPGCNGYDKIEGYFYRTNAAFGYEESCLRVNVDFYKDEGGDEPKRTTETLIFKLEDYDGSWSW